MVGKEALAVACQEARVSMFQLQLRSSRIMSKTTAPERWMIGRQFHMLRLSHSN